MEAIVIRGDGFLYDLMTAKKYYRWIPALLVMGATYWFSSQPSNELPDFGVLDWLFKKSGHVIEYALLAVAYWYALGWNRNRRQLAWLFAILYAVTDEFHQSFVPGRFPSVWDVLIFDNLGAVIGLWFANRYSNKNDQGTSPDRS